MSGPGEHGPGGPGGHGAGGHPVFPEPRAFPRVTEVGVLSMIAVIIGVIWMAAHLPNRPPLVLPTVLAIVAAVILAANIAVLGALKDFAWYRFFQVFRWGLAAYLVIAGMIEYAFIYDGTRGAPLVLMTVFLAIFTANVPILLAFTVARFETRPESEGAL